MKVHSLLTEDLVLSGLAGGTRDEALREMAGRLGGRAGAVACEALLAKLLEREELGTTAIGGGIAIPHCKVEGLDAPVLMLGLSRAGIPFGAVDGQDTHAVFLLVSPLEKPEANLRVLAAIAKLARRTKTLAARLVQATTPAEALRTLREIEDGHHA
jgi:mannitol/fructose-specific phosphotransferase system IIA component (Ntr-type)